VTHNAKRQVLASENFERGVVTGWSNPSLNHCDAFTSVLGIFGEGDSSKKTYAVPTGTDKVTVQFDLYKFDDPEVNGVVPSKYMYVKIGNHLEEPRPMKESHKDLPMELNGNAEVLLGSKPFHHSLWFLCQARTGTLTLQLK
jgi:hypothetical protein